MLQIRLLGQFDIRLDRRRITIPSRVGQSLFAYLVLTAGTAHRREKLAGLFWPDTSDDVARKYLRQELWRIRKALLAQQNDEGDYLLADEFTIAFNRSASYWLDVAQLERPDLDLESLTSNLTLVQGELLPGFYESWIVLERERIQSSFDSKMGQLLDLLVASNRWTAVQEQAERWLALGNSPEPAFRALMLAYGARGDMVKVSSVYQRCISELKELYGLEPSAETRALYDGLLKGANVPGRPALHPSGTVTFLFTDIEGSTNLLDKLGDQYAAVLATHHKIMRDALQKWNGREVDTQGDAFFVTFARALDAVQCAAEMQRSLQTYPWTENKSVRVRMGLHTGEPLITGTGYVGMDVHRAARIGDAAHGGQVLLSQTTRELVMNELPKAITVRDLGEHRLKDLKFPTPIYQLVIEGLTSDFPPVRTKFSGTEAPTPGEPPFKGLQYFEEADSDLFFGREVLTAKLIDRLRVLPSPEGDREALRKEGPGRRVEPVETVRFLSVIIGASGSGKSSLVRAGLIPALKNGQALIDGSMPPEGSTGWQIHIITPTAHPLAALATEMMGDSDSATSAAWIEDLTQDPRSLTHRLEKRDTRRHTLLVVDQFEELFTLCRDEFEREAFIDNLLTALSQENSPFTLVLTLRADFYAHLAQYPELRDAVARQQEYIGPMSMEELRRAIEEPARRGHWAFEPGLVDLILRDIGDEPGALPLLSHALLETWKRRAGHVLTLKGYAEAGGVHGAIAHTAESVYQNLTPEEQEIGRDIFLRLTELGEGTEDTRRRASFDELMSDRAAVDDVRQVLNMLAEARLITLNQDTAEVAHEALIREWPTLREWLNQDREGLQLHRRLTEAAHEWELLERDPGRLFRGAQLAQTRAWAELHPNVLNAGERTFLSSSVDQEQREEQEREEQQKRELEAAQKLAETERARAEEQTHSANRLRTRNRVITTVGAIALILALLAGMFGVRSNQNEVRAEANFKQAEAQRLALEANRLLTADGSSEQIALLSLRSMQTQYTTEGDAALSAAARLEYPVKSFTAGTNKINALAFSPDEKYILTGGDDKTPTLWDVQSGQEVRRFIGHTGVIFKVYFSPDGKNVLTVDNAGNVIMWDAATGQERYRLATDSPLVWIAYSHDGKKIFTSNEDNTIRQWDAASGKEIGVILTMSDPVWIEVSPDGRYMLIINSTAQLWDLETTQKICDFSFDTSALSLWSFSPDGKYVLTGSLHGDVQLWDTKTCQEVRSFIGHTDPIFGEAFTPDYKYIVTSSADKTVRIWDIATGQELRRLFFSSFVSEVAVSPDGKWILTSSRDGMVRLWAFEARPSYPILNHGVAVSALAFSPDGKSILTAGDDGIARLWDAITGEKLRDFIGHTDTINYGAAFSPDGKSIVTGSYDTTVRLWDARIGEEVHQFVGDTVRILDVQFSPDGKSLLTAGNDGVRLWDAQTGEKIRQFGELQGVYRATFSPDGKYVLSAASGSDDGKARLWEASTGELIREYQSALGEMSAVNFSPDGKYIIADGGDNIVHIWDTQTGKELRQLIGHTSVLYTEVFSPDGKTIATASVDATARLWDVQTGVELRRFIGHTAAVENVAFSPDGKRIVTSSDDGTAMLWDVDYHTTMQYLCRVLLRDFTEEERAQYGIKDKTPTCPGK
jgi:WD40 repeat protein/class 3 adenylate cyclase